MSDDAMTAEGAAAAIAALLHPEQASQWLRFGVKMLSKDRRPPVPNRAQLMLLAHMEDQGGRCYYCRTQMSANGPRSTRPTLDHKQPRSRMGPDTEENTAAACALCNEDKGNLTEAEYWAVLAVRQQTAAE